MHITPALPDRGVDLAMAYQPMIAADSGLPFAWQAVATAGDGRSFSRVAATLAPERRPALEALRITLAVEGAVAAGLLETDALLALPLSVAGGTPEPLLAHLFRTLVEHRFPADRLVVEVNADERGDFARAATLVRACADRYVDVAFDRFAAGPLALGLLARFTPHSIKLDAGLVRNIATSISRRLIVEGVLRLARSMDVTLIACGVESRADVAALRAMGIRHLQGDWINAPMMRTLPRAHVARRDPRGAVPQHRRLAHHQRAAAAAVAAPRPPAPSGQILAG